VIALLDVKSRKLREYELNSRVENPGSVPAVALLPELEECCPEATEEGIHVLVSSVTPPASPLETMELRCAMNLDSGDDDEEEEEERPYLCPRSSLPALSLRPRKKTRLSRNDDSSIDIGRRLF
jgi:hypothetical protein